MTCFVLHRVETCCQGTEVFLVVGLTGWYGVRQTLCAAASHWTLWYYRFDPSLRQVSNAGKATDHMQGFHVIVY